MAKPLNFSNCTSCGQCLISCPTGALIEHVQFPELDAHIHDAGKVVVVQYSSAVAVSVSEQLGYKPGTDLAGIINAVLRRYGVDYVFETSFGAEVMMMEQTGIYLEREKAESGLPLITSSCPAWVQYVEQYYPELIPHLSPLKSPHQVMGALIRSWASRAEHLDNKEVVSVVITSCTAAKSEARRIELTTSGIPIVDLVLTTRELARLIKLSGLDLDQLDPELPDAPFYSTGSAGHLTAVAGGEVEATMRTLFGTLTGSNLAPAKLHRFRIHKPYREMALKVGDKEIKFGMVSGLSNAVNVIADIKAGRKKLDMLEVMACPDGCINGGGQPLPVDDKLKRARSKAVYDIDNGSKLHASNCNPAVDKVYHDLLGEPGGELNRSLFCTTFSKREVLL